MKGSSRRSVRIGDLCAIKHGYAFKGEYFGSEGSHIVLTPGNFFDEGGFKRKGDKEKWYSGEIPEEYVLSQGDLLVAMTEQAEGLLGSAAIVPENDRYLHNQRLGLIQNLNGVGKRFLYYVFNSQPIRQQIRASCSGVKVRHTSPSRIYEVKVDIPPLHTQRKIAAILSAYDGLIDNNLRRIKILEGMAQNLYREWFVKFRFPGHQHARFIDSPIGKIPESWKVDTVANTFAILGGGTPSRAVSQYWDEGTGNWYSPTDLTAAGSMFVERSGSQITELGLKESSARLFPPFSVMMTSRATLGVISINTTEACTNQGFITCVPNESFPLYTLFYWLKENVEYFISLGTGATFKEITKGVFKTIELVVPAQPVVTQFERTVQQFALQILNLQRRNTILRSTRDLLLPKLISGEVDVSDVDIAVPDEVVQ